jgi:hypothetical protein
MKSDGVDITEIKARQGAGNMLFQLKEACCFKTFVMQI